MMLASRGARAAPVTIGGAFTLTTPDGTKVTDQTFRGDWLLVYFGYTSCPDSCPTTLVVIAKALADLGPQAARVRPLFITIDPLRDTRERMGDYTSSFDRRILGLTGTPREIEEASKAYGVYAVRHDAGTGSQDGLFDHSTYIYLMNPSGRFVRAFDPDWSGDRIASAVRDAMARFSATDTASRAMSPR